MNPHGATLLETLQSRYYRLGILPISPDTDEERLAKQVVQSCGGISLNVGLTLSERLMEIPMSQRPLRTPIELGALLPQTPCAVVLYHLPLLFHPELQTNGFRLLLQLSRNMPMIALLCCRYNERFVWYAEPGHPEYQQHTIEDVYLISPREAVALGWEECDEIS